MSGAYNIVKYADRRCIQTLTKNMLTSCEYTAVTRLKPLWALLLLRSKA